MTTGPPGDDGVADSISWAGRAAGVCGRGGCGLVEAFLDQHVGLALDLVLGLLARLFLGEPLLVLVVGNLA